MKKLLILFLLISDLLYSQTIFFHEDMEIPDSVTSSGVYGFTQNSTYQSQGDYSMHGTFTINTECMLTTKAFSTIGQNVVVVEFDHIAKLENFDYAQVEYSSDSVNWLVLSSINNCVYYGASYIYHAIGYKFAEVSYNNWGSGTTNLPSSTWWQHETFDISALASNKNTNYIRFKLKDGNQTGTGGRFGWLLDGIVVSNRHCHVTGSMTKIQCLTPGVSNPTFQITCLGYAVSDSLSLLINYGDGTDSVITIPALNSGLIGFPHLYSITGNLIVSAVLADSYGFSDTLFLDVNVVGGCDSITGNVFMDNDSNCIYNVGDTALLSMLSIRSATLNISTMTNANGYYAVYCPLGNYVIRANSLASNCNLTTPCSNGIDSIVVASIPSHNNNFVLSNISPLQDLVMFGYFSKANNAPDKIKAFCYGYSKNCNVVDGAITANFSSNIDSIFDSGSNSFISGNSYSFPNKFYPTIYQNKLFTAKSNNGFLSNDTICLQLIADTLSLDVSPPDNVVNLCYAYSNLYPYDPNGKMVFPNGDIQNNAELFYEIHFQNTGTGPAINVVVVDTISTHLDLNTFSVLSSTHNINTVIDANRVVQFMFPNINLPDSGSNYQGSMGSLLYTIKPYNSLAVGSKIINAADIYFDNNLPIRTNTTLNTIAIPTDVTSITTVNKQVSIYPNPVGNGLVYNCKGLKAGIKLTATVYDALGKIHLTQNTNASTIDISTLTPGLYVLRLQQGDKIYYGRFVKE